MKKAKPRDRLMSFRVTDEEYRAIERAAEAAGARSVSAYARAKLLEAREVPHADPR